MRCLLIHGLDSRLPGNDGRWPASQLTRRQYLR
jgi:hypothetical protein